MNGISGQQNKRSILAAVAALALALIACGGGGSAPESKPTDTPGPTNTPGVTGCINDALFVTDVNIEDGTVMIPGEPFEKMWRMENNGSCDWQIGYVLELDSGDLMGSPQSVVLSQEVAPGERVDLTVPFTVPVEPGTYRSVWQLSTAEGDRFGSRVSVEIVVEPEGSVADEDESAALASLKDELFFASSQPYVMSPCQDLGRQILVVVQPVPVQISIMPTRAFFEIEGVSKPTPVAGQTGPVSGITGLSPEVLAQLMVTRPVLRVEPLLPTATPIPPELKIEDRGSGRFVFCLAGIPRDEEITVRLRAPDGQVYMGSFIWPAGNEVPQWLSPPITGAVTPVSAGDSGVALSVRLPFGSFPVGEWQVNATGDGLNLSDTFETTAVPKIAVPDFHTFNPFDIAPVVPDCATYDLSPSTRISVIGAGFAPETTVPIGFYNPGLANGKAVTADERGRFELEVEAGEFEQPGPYTVIAVIDPERDVYLDTSPQVSCFHLQ